MGRGRPQPGPLELALWHHAIRDVQPLGGRAAEDPPAPQAPPTVIPPPTLPQAPAAAAPSQPAPAPSRRGTGHGLDRRTRQRLQRGQYPISARLDLHGMTQDAAHATLMAFVQAEQRRGSRCILVITGRGLRSGGVLRSMTPRWLATPPLADLVLAQSPARIPHGGDGAFYVLLRRSR